MDSPFTAVPKKGIVLDFQVWDKEIGLMNEKAGMTHVSTTLIIQGKAIPLYHKAYGFLFDATKVKVEHVGLRDIGSQDPCQANPADFSSLQELRKYYDNSQGGFDMNEVNVTIPRSAIAGLVIRKGVTAPTAIAGFEAVRSYLRVKGFVLPTYEYDERNGEMVLYQEPDKAKLFRELRPVYQKACEQLVI